MKRKLLAMAVGYLLAAAVAPPAHAEASDSTAEGVRSSLTLLSGFVSKHSRSGYCENNVGIGLRHDATGYLAGVYKNSLCRTSFYVGREFLYEVNGNFRVGAAAVAVTGYNYALILGVMPVAEFRFGRGGRYAVAFTGSPFSSSVLGSAFIAAQFRYSF